VSGGFGTNPDVNDAPVITSPASVSASENQTAALTVTASDPDGDTLSYSIIGGADASLFSINATTGVLTFNAAPNFEAPADAGANNVYQVRVLVADRSLGTIQNISIAVTNANEVLTFTSPSSSSAAENQTAAIDVDATDPDAGAVLTYSITGGADAALFSINSSTGVVTFNSAPNFEFPADADHNNVYDIQVQASDGSLSDTQSISITVTDVNEAPTITSSATANAAENQTVAIDVDATDPDAGAVLTYSIVGGVDAACFGIDSSTGALSFVPAPDFEAPADADANNVYEVQVQVSDGSLTATQNVSITVTDVNEAPTITSSASTNAAENQTSAITVTAYDQDAGATLAYSIVGGPDASLFNIDSTTGVLSFLSAPNFEMPADSDTDNVYDVQVQVSDGSLSDTQTILVTVTNVNEAPAITSSATPSAQENQTSALTVTATDPDAGATLTYSIVGGADASLFSINSATGVVTFNSAPNFESPADAGGNNVYDIQVQVSDGSLTATQNVAITVTNVNEAPTITSSATANAAENQTSALTVTATDPDAGATLTYSIVGGADQSLFSINSATGVVTFNTAPNFEAPTDSGANNVYDIQVQVSDGTLTATQNVSITVTNVNEAPTITSSATASVQENQTSAITVTATDPDAGTTLTYSIVGGADASLFSINSSTGVVTFNVAPDFEAPTDAGANNVYDFQVQVSDGSLTATQNVSITVTDDPAA
jgi:VCBS repeat-containing protein